MFSIIKVIFALFAISSCNILFGESSIKRELNHINKHLVDTVQTTDLAENFKAIRELSDEEAKRGIRCNPFSKSCSKALETLVSLEEIKCDGRYYSDLKQINDALENEAHKKNQPIRRISKIVHELSMKHAKDCQSTYYNVFESKVASQDQNLANNVKIFYNSLVGSYLYCNLKQPCWIKEYTTAGELLHQILYGVNCIWWDRRSEVWKVLNLSTKDSDDSKSLRKIDDEIHGVTLVDESKIRAVYEKYLVNPCKYYISHFGPEVFAPAMYDAELYHEVDESKRDFYLGMAHYKVCSKFLLSEQDVFEKVLVSAKSQ